MNIVFPKPNTEVLDEVDELIENIALWELVVFNDDINSFDHVITTLIDICQHSPEQAEQCTIIIHYKGKSSVKAGEYDELASMRNAICRRGIQAEVMIR